jgi:hypothetical protein
MTKEGSQAFWKEMPENCIVAQKQFKGDWVGSYESDVWIVCKDKDDKIVDIIREYKLPFNIDWSGVPMDDKYGYTPTFKRDTVVNIDSLILKIVKKVYPKILDDMLK